MPFLFQEKNKVQLLERFSRVWIRTETIVDPKHCQALVRYLFAEPEAVVNSEGVDRHGQMLCVDLGELLSSWNRAQKCSIRGKRLSMVASKHASQIIFRIFYTACCHLFLKLCDFLYGLPVMGLLSVTSLIILLVRDVWTERYTEKFISHINWKRSQRIQWSIKL
jgi:hypothetical protein